MTLELIGVTNGQKNLYISPVNSGWCLTDSTGKNIYFLGCPKGAALFFVRLPLVGIVRFRNGYSIKMMQVYFVYQTNTEP